MSSSAPIDSPDPVQAMVRDALALRRMRLDQPFWACYSFAEQHATRDCWDMLLRSAPLHLANDDTRKAHAYQLIK